MSRGDASRNVSSYEAYTFNYDYIKPSTKAVTVETHELKNGAGRHWKNQISYDKDYTTFIKTVTEHKTNDKKEKQIEKNVKEKNDSFVLDNAIIK